MIRAIEGAAALSSVQALDAGAGPLPLKQTSSNGAPESFAELMQLGVDRVGDSVKVAESAMRDLAAGKPVELHEVMISLERASISVQTFIQIRNKLVESYQDLMRIQL